MSKSKPRYATLEEFRFRCQGRPVWAIAQLLRRSEKTIQRYIDGDCKIPWWVPEMLRYLNDEFHERIRQHQMEPIFRKLGVVTGDVIEFKPKAARPRTTESPPTHQRTEQCQLDLFERNQTQQG